MMAEDPNQSSCLDSLIGAKIHGEGNYASAMYSEMRDQDTDHGLTLSPKIQFNDPWFENAVNSFDEQDLDALLGPINFDLIAETQKNDLGSDNSVNDPYQHSERPAKRQKRAREVSKVTPSLQLSEATGQQETSSFSHCNVAQAPSSFFPAVEESQQVHAVARGADISQSLLLPQINDHSSPQRFINSSMSTAETSRLAQSNATPASSHAPMTISASPSDLECKEPMLCSVLIPTKERSSSHEELQDLCEIKEGAQHGEETGSQIPDFDVEDGWDGSLFGDCEETHAELSADLEAELEAGLDTERESGYRSTHGLTLPTVSIGSTLYTTNHPTASIPHQGQASPVLSLSSSVHFENGSGQGPERASNAQNVPYVAPAPKPLASTIVAGNHWDYPIYPDFGQIPVVDNSGYFAPEPSRASAPAVSVEKECRTNNSSIRPVPPETESPIFRPLQAPVIFQKAGLPATDNYPPYWHPEALVPSVESNTQKRQPSRNSRGKHFPAKRSSAELLSLKSRLLDLELKLAEFSSRTPLPADQLSAQRNISREANAARNNLSTSQHDPAPLPYLLALSLASGNSKEAIKDAYQQISQMQSSDHVPPQLRTLLDSLYSKFFNDPKFRTSTLTWAIEKVSTQRTHCCESASELSTVKEELERVTIERDAYKALADELKLLV